MKCRTDGKISLCPYYIDCGFKNISTTDKELSSLPKSLNCGCGFESRCSHAKQCYRINWSAKKKLKKTQGIQS